MKLWMMMCGAALVSGCAMFEGLRTEPSAPAPAPAPVAAPAAAPKSGIASVLGGGAVAPEALDRASAEEKAAAAAPATGARALGTAVAGLGDPAQPGFWLKTPLVSAETAGRVDYGGASAAVTLIPLDGDGGSQMSLSAMRLLNAPLAELVEVTVFAL
jgi:hypothetical protein